MERVIVDQGKQIFAKFLEAHSELSPGQFSHRLQKKKEASLLITQPDELVVFR